MAQRARYASMEPPISNDKILVPPLVPVSIAAPRATDGAGSALRRAFPAPGALPHDMLRLLRELGS